MPTLVEVDPPLTVAAISGPEMVELRAREALAEALDAEATDLSARLERNRQMRAILSAEARHLAQSIIAAHGVDEAGKYYQVDSEKGTILLTVRAVEDAPEPVIGRISVPWTAGEAPEATLPGPTDG